MITSDWINLIAAILVGGGTLSLGIMAWRTIHQTRTIQKAEKKERLLNEIIEWASGCMSCVFEIDRPNLREAKSAEQYIDRMQTGLTDKLKSFQTKEKYIKGIAPPLLFGQSLSNAIKISIDCLDLTIKCIEKDTPNTDEEQRKQVKEQLNEFIDREGGGLYKCMNKVLEEAAKIKTKEIGREEENMSKEGEATVSKEPTTKDILEHLKRQDRQMTRATYFAGAAVGAAIILVAVSLWVGRTVLSTDAFYWTYIFLLACGFGLMSWCWYKQRKIKG